MPFCLIVTLALKFNLGQRKYIVVSRKKLFFINQLSLYINFFYVILSVTIDQL